MFASRKKGLELAEILPNLEHLMPRCKYSCKQLSEGDVTDTLLFLRDFAQYFPVIVALGNIESHDEQSH